MTLRGIQGHRIIQGHNYRISTVLVAKKSQCFTSSSSPLWDSSLLRALTGDLVTESFNFSIPSYSKWCSGATLFLVGFLLSSTIGTWFWFASWSITAGGVSAGSGFWIFSFLTMRSCWVASFTFNEISGTPELARCSPDLKPLQHQLNPSPSHFPPPQKTPTRK